MKQFFCGDVVPGCTARFEAPTEDEILMQVAEHAKSGHGIPEVPTELVEKIRALIREVPAA